MYILASLYQLAQCPASKMMMILWWKGSSCADSDGCPIYGQPRPFLEHFSSSSSSFSHCNSHHHDHHHHNQQMLMCWSKKNPKKTRFFIDNWSKYLEAGCQHCFCGILLLWHHGQKGETYKWCPTVQMVKWCSGWRCSRPPLSRRCEPLWTRVTAQCAICTCTYCSTLLHSHCTICCKLHQS